MDSGGAGDPNTMTYNNLCPDGVVLDYPPAAVSSKGDSRPGVRCSQVDQPPLTIDVGQKPQMVLGPSQALEINWTQKSDPVLAASEIACPREDPLSYIPKNTVAEVVADVKAGKSDVIKKSELNDPMCPEAQNTMTIDLPQNKGIEYRVPEFKWGVRLPQRAWRQCVESSLINDRVRRPLARWCHKRELPPIVLPTHEVDRMRLQGTERERMVAAYEEMKTKQDFEKERSRCHHSQWNHTTESLLEKKRRKQEEKDRMEVESSRRLIEEVAGEKHRESKEQSARAKKLMLHRKGLIRDFNAALAYSKMMQDNDILLKEKSKEKASPPFSNDTCMEKMMHKNSRSDYTKKENKIKPVNQKLLASVQKLESRQKEHEVEMNNELLCIKQLMTEYLPERPEAYKEDIKEPVCGADEKRREQSRLRTERLEEMQNHLAVDSFIESHENEINRQACEFNKYKQRVDNIRKAKDKQLIDEKVANNIRMGEKAGAVLVEMQKERKKNEGKYDALKQKWEAEWKEKFSTKGALKEKLMEHIYRDFWERQNIELSKRQLLDSSREWARERLNEAENFHKECSQKSEKRKKAEDIALFNQAQASEKKCRESRAKYMDSVWGAKMNQEYEREMCEMKGYANDCIKDWKTKGRSSIPMTHAMKKWDYDAGMYPFASVAIDREKNRVVANFAKKVNCPSYESTSQRLGFSYGVET